MWKNYCKENEEQKKVVFYKVFIINITVLYTGIGMI